MKDNIFKIICLITSIILSITICVSINTESFAIKKITINNKLNENNQKTIEVKIKNPLDKKISCAINTKNECKNINWNKSKNNKCVFNVDSGNYYIFIKDEKDKIKSSKKTKVEINEILDININSSKVFLTLGETFNIETEIISIGNTDNTLTFISDDENIANVNNNTIIPVNYGKTNITIKSTNNIEKRIEVIVTELYSKASQENNQEKLSCNRYNIDEARLLDEILEFKINQAGHKTRGAVVTAARFLVLEFPYRIDYFFENGRLNNYGKKAYVDGEGRYYKKGLYLHEEKYSTLLATKYGPATWGCPLTNWQNDHGYVKGKKYPNGLDCSGFVTWALYNAGFDVGDSGAGDTYRDDDIGEDRKSVV